MQQSGVAELAATMRGAVLTPDDSVYDEARHVWNGTIDKRPALIARCQGVADVIDAVNFARREGLGISVRGGGHHVAGGSLIHDGLVVDLSLMRAVRVNTRADTVWAEGGALIGDVDRETQVFGRAVPFGLVSETGIGGLTLAGGLGWMRRKHGLSSDNLVSAEVVTADGQLLTASREENADLFWALRGGGWDLGVVTAFEFRTYPLGPEVFFLFTAYPMDQAQQVLADFASFAHAAPEEVGAIAVLWTFPSSEPYSTEIWGKQFVGIAGPYCGPVDEGERVMQPLRELGTPLLDMSGRMPYVAVQQSFDEEYPKGRRYYWKSTYLRELDGAALETIVRLGSQRPSPLTSLDVWPLGGAFAAVGSDETPVGHRDAPFLIGLESNWESSQEDAANIAWARDAATALAPYSTGGSYLNFEDLSVPTATAAAHGSNYDRLVSIKRKYDPENLFRSRGGLA